ncbi:hypothetical protein RM572_13370 [Streptomyces sp. DSM 42041]|uniref:Zinc ribbon domain-containing protein n=1 Tax=Streptomyces hazeniae TaxID=3075538 RepID=A0ABU2NRZ0_9ACTN|nr:hypothetical protein [Streptomyces sp. DSM 42041]MDT0379754.1 hypothetical protein [Streptomyces sp. DSM 42041]
MATSQPSPAAGPPGKIRRSFLPRWRFFTWVILAFNLIMLIWVITGATSGPDCSGKTGDALTTCQAGQVGTGIGVSLLIVLWALSDVILGVLWLVTKPHGRNCPACGNSVRKGVMQCRSCGYDFRRMLQQDTRTGPVQGGTGRGWGQERSGP